MNFHSVAPKQYKRSVVAGFVHRIFRACSNWENFHTSLTKAKTILEHNQYPAGFYEPIISATIEKLVSPTVEPQASNVPNSNIPTSNTPASKFPFRVQYRGQNTDRFVKQLKAHNAPIQPIITLRKLNTTMPSLKPAVPKLLRSNVVYQICCPGCNSCYVGQTHRHIGTRFSEHRTRWGDPVRPHFNSCIGSQPTSDDLQILKSTVRSVDFLETLEALYIREIKPSINSKDEYRSRALSIQFG